MAKRNPKATIKRSLAIVSSIAVLMTCGTTGLFSASAAEIDDTTASSAVEPAVKGKIKIFDEEQNDLTASDNSEPIIYLDNTYLAGGKWSKTLDIYTEDVINREIKYQVDPQPVGKEHIVVSKDTFSSTNDHLRLTINGAVYKNNKLVSLDPGTTKIHFSSENGLVYKTLTVVVYAPATDMTVYWGNKNTKLGLNDENMNNDIDLIAVANHQYQLYTDLTPKNSTDKVEYSVYDGDFIYENNYVPTKPYVYLFRDNENEIIKGYEPKPTNKAEITSNGYFTAKENGTVTIVVKPKATETSNREMGLGAKKREEYVYKDGKLEFDSQGMPKTKITSDPEIQTLPKYIHVTIAKENPASKLEILNRAAASSIQIDNKLQLELKATPTYTGEDYLTGATDVFKWVSSNPDVAEVDEKGLVTAISKGKTKITVYGEKENVYAECDVEVYTPAQAITFDKTDGNMRTIRVDVPVELSATLTPSDSNERIVWESSNPDIAVIEPISTGELTNIQKAVLTGKSVGQATIIAKTVDVTSTVDPETNEEIITTTDKIVTKLEVDVQAKNLSGSIKIEKAEGNNYLLVPEESIQTIYTQSSVVFRSSLLTESGLAADDKTVWEIADNDDKNLKVQVDTVDGKEVSSNGIFEGQEISLHGVSNGTVTVTAHSKTKPEISQVFNIQVLTSCDKIIMNNVYGEKISTTKPLNIGKLFTVIPDLTINGNTPYAHDDKITSWSSSNPDVATVDEYGNVRGISIGNTVITATAASGRANSVEVNVFSPSRVEISNSKIVPSLDNSLPTLTLTLNTKKEASINLTGVVEDSYGTTVNKTVDCEWTSSNEEIATINSRGVVTAHTPGSTIITARSGETDKIDQVLLYILAPVSLTLVNEIEPMVYSPYADAYEPKPTVYYDNNLLFEGIDYTLAYNNNIPTDNKPVVGKAQVTITGIGNYVGNIKISFTISAKNIADEDIEVDEIPALEYTGKTLTPSINISYIGYALEPGKDYKVSYKNNTKPGEATVAVSGLGNFAGTMNRSFTIYCNHEELKNVKVVKEATHEEAGIEEGICVKCGNRIQREIPKKTQVGICGDIDGDGTPSSADALSILRYSVGLEDLTDAQQYLADVNGDNAIDSLDSLSVLRYSVGYTDNDNVGKEM